MGCEPFRFCGYSFRQKHRVCFTMQYKSPHNLIEITHQKRWLYVRIACKLQPKTIVPVPPQPCKTTNRNSQWHCFPYPFFILSPPDKRNTAGLFLPIPTQNYDRNSCLSPYYCVESLFHFSANQVLVGIPWIQTSLEQEFSINKIKASKESLPHPRFEESVQEGGSFLSFIAARQAYKAVKAVIKPKMIPGALAKARGRSRFSLKRP